MLKAGIIGLGVGERHIAGYQQSGRAEVVALCDIDPAKAQMAREKYPGMTFYGQADELLRHPGLDVVSIASFDQDHYDQLRLAYDLNLHVFVEKPLCQFDWQLRELEKLRAAKPGLKMSSNLILRRAPRFIDLKTRIARGELGTLYHAEADYVYGRLHKITAGWRAESPFYSVIQGGGVHVIDLLMWLTGETPVDAVAIGNRISSAGTAFRHPDMVAALLRFPSGMTAKVSANFGSVYPHFHKLQLYGTGATFENGPETGLLWTSRDPDMKPLALTGAYPGAAKGDMIPAFIAAILDGAAMDVSAEDVFTGMRACLAVDKALAEGRFVRLDEI